MTEDEREDWTEMMDASRAAKKANLRQLYDFTTVKAERRRRMTNSDSYPTSAEMQKANRPIDMAGRLERERQLRLERAGKDVKPASARGVIPDVVIEPPQPFVRELDLE